MMAMMTSHSTLKNDTLTNCQVEDISFYTDTMGVEFTIQDTSEVMEELA